ncbi:DUF4375 domain-containing protein [Paenibacillus solisilvae]|uniref:DUF4375 domain-containing protein n=1 Tax=Paenibacillus solisilvae TaxID=2486751 RepID=A0ABW0WBB7_9BACL
MVIRKINKELLDKKPYEAWNAFIDLIAMEEYKDLNQTQRTAHLCFWYDTEVQNGGHLQYFENKGIEKMDETIDALKVIGAAKQANILNQASATYSSKNRKKLNDIFAFVNEARCGEFEEYDNEYYNSEPTVTDLLGEYFEIYSVN